MHLRPRSRFFTLLLGFMAALPTAGIDIVLPSLPVTGRRWTRPSPG